MSDPAVTLLTWQSGSFDQESSLHLPPKVSQEHPEIGQHPHSCCHCRKIIIRQPALHGHDSFRCRLPYTVREAYQAAKDGCPIYRLLIRGYFFATSPKEANMLTRAVLGKPDYRLPRAGVYGAHDRVIYLAECLSRHPFQVRFDGQGHALFICLAWGSHWFQINAWPGITHPPSGHWDMTEVCVGDPLASLFPVRPINREVASLHAFDLARTWLTECAGHGSELHLLCPKIGNVGVSPKRLLKIDAVNNRYNIRLRETSSHEPLSYACLSYCWGGDQPVKTTKATLAQRRKGIHFQSLPKTLQDAITVTVNLQISHLWIDCLCMIQDDEDDMLAELPNMPEIYKKAHVTISASSANTCYDGFLQKRQLPPNAECEDVILQYDAPTGVVGNVYLFEDQSRTIADPISKRAWTLQERRISPRFLDFSSQQLRWICNSRHYFDGGLKAEVLDMQAEETGIQQTSDRSRSEAIEHAIFRTWADILDDYTQRSLSFPSDKLVALAAMASEVGTGVNMAYVAGLWKEHLPAQLLWRLWAEPSKRPAEYRAPS